MIGRRLCEIAISAFIAGALHGGCLSPAAAQSTVSVIGPVTPGNCANFSSTTIIKDAGTTCGGGGVIPTSLILHVNKSTGVDTGLCPSAAPCLTIAYAQGLIQSQQVRSPSGGAFPTIQVDTCTNFTESVTFIGTGRSLNGATKIRESGRDRGLTLCMDRKQHRQERCIHRHQRVYPAHVRIGRLDHGFQGFHSVDVRQC